MSRNDPDYRARAPFGTAARQHAPPASSPVGFYFGACVDGCHSRHKTITAIHVAAGGKSTKRSEPRDQGASMQAGRSSRFGVFRVAVVLACGGLLAACSHAPQEPAPVFALPLSKIVGAPAIDGQAPAPPAAEPATRQLRYIAVPAGRKVSGMAHAHVIL